MCEIFYMIFLFPCFYFAALRLVLIHLYPRFFRHIYHVFLDNINSVLVFSSVKNICETFLFDTFSFPMRYFAALYISFFDLSLCFYAFLVFRYWIFWRSLKRTRVKKIKEKLHVLDSPQVSEIYFTQTFPIILIFHSILSYYSCN